MDDNVDRRILYISNLSHRVTDELLYELFLQAGPIELCIIREKSKTVRIGVIEYKYEASVEYAKDIFEGVALYGHDLLISSTNLMLQPVDYGPKHERPYVENRRQNNYNARRWNNHRNYPQNYRRY